MIDPLGHGRDGDPDDEQRPDDRGQRRRFLPVERPESGQRPPPEQQCGREEPLGGRAQGDRRQRRHAEAYGAGNGGHEPPRWQEEQGERRCERHLGASRGAPQQISRPRRDDRAGEYDPYVRSGRRGDGAGDESCDGRRWPVRRPLGLGRRKPDEPADGEEQGSGGRQDHHGYEKRARSGLRDDRPPAPPRRPRPGDDEPGRGRCHSRVRGAQHLHCRGHRRQHAQDEKRRVRCHEPGWAERALRRGGRPERRQGESGRQRGEPGAASGASARCGNQHRANQDQQESGLHNQVKIGVSWCGSHLALSAADETRAYRPRRRRSLGNQSLSRARIAKPPFEMSG